MSDNDPLPQIDSLPNSLSLPFFEEMQEAYEHDPTSVDPRWRAYFEQMRNGHPNGTIRRGPSFASRSIFAGAPGAASSSASEARQDRADQMVRAYRVRGHMIAKIDPLGRERPSPPELDPDFYGFTEADMDQPFSSRTIKGPDVRTLREIVGRLQSTYCRYIGAQFMHIDESRVRHWLQERMEGSENRCSLSRREQFRILTRLTDATILEEFIQTKFVGAKSFSLEGGESLIPLLDLAIEKAGTEGIDEIVIGMPHRGRLNVLANILGKSPLQIFREFRDLEVQENIGRGDVKYHLGYHGDWRTAGGKDVHVALCFNPSHLEFVNPVAMGRMRAKQDRMGDHDRKRGMVVQIHGDAAFAGEGIVQETLQLSELDGYRTGGSLHVIVNNQIGFTTPPDQARSSIYASAIGKMLQIPIFHVNGEEPESVAQVVNLAMDFRREFQRDVIIDMYCYRKRGHNEADEPAFTQPQMYKAIRKRQSVRESYLRHLLKLGEVTVEQADEIKKHLTESLERHLSNASENGKENRKGTSRPSILGRIWKNYLGGKDSAVPDGDTSLPEEQLADLSLRLTQLPDDLTPHPKMKRLLAARAKMANGEQPYDWAGAEAAAFASLVTTGSRLRMTGQDVERGTFSHRHAVLNDYETGRKYTPLANLAENQGEVEIVNSPLNESGVMGFEYGYSIACPDGLVIWEAQFGDFANVAQVIIDQFITSAEDKWGSLSGLVLLLPHGMEGQGPEHSSARPERFLQLAAEDNIQVCNLTTPANYFHCLRRQMLRPMRKPLIVMTPKSLLRHPQAVSTRSELANGNFQRVIPDTKVEAKKVKSVLLCTGKVYYDLANYREEHKRDDVAIVRVEQIYPLADETLQAAIDPYGKKVPVTWVQEEPENMGYWAHLRVRFGETIFGRSFGLQSRPQSASPATGSAASHKLEQQLLLMRAFGD